MELSEKDKQEIINWITIKCGGILRCHCCGQNNWTLSPTSSLSIGFDIHTTRFYYHQGIPQVTIVCMNCAYLLNFSPSVMGFKPDIPKVQEINTESTNSES